jgi:hypothetical protein
MRTTLTIDDDIYKVARNIAQARGISIGRAVSELALRGLERSYQGDTEGGLPVFSVSDSARPITLEDVKKLEDQV